MTVPQVQQQLPATHSECRVDIDGMIEEFTLNTEQARAFRIISEHSLTNDSPPLRMYLDGAGGTGKSRVINT
jgi:hypothetical protein